MDADLDATYRIDLEHVAVEVDFDPQRPTLTGTARLQFTMRPGQTVPLFHFDPLLNGGDATDALTEIRLDGEPVPTGDIAPITFDGSDQIAMEVEWEPGPGAHTLEIRWEAPSGLQGPDYPERPGWYWTQVEDIVGFGNEALWPTINAPHAQALHSIAVRIAGDREYVGVGSGVTTTRNGDVQVIALDTDRPIASYTVMIAAVPRDAVTVRTFEVAGVPVTLVSDLDQEDTDEAEQVTRSTLPALQADFGPFPMDSLQILLTDWDGGMEYHGATATGLDAVSHELVHMYWGVSGVQATWRDTWVDEAITTWWDERPRPLRSNRRYGFVADRSPIEIGFDDRAYGQGARMFSALADRVGGDTELVALLRAVHAERAFTPFTTTELIDDLEAATGDPSIRASMERWVLE